MDFIFREVFRAYSGDGCNSILLGDVDHFKNVNDTLGHVTGDEVLREIARRLLASVRSYDFVGRYGGGGVLRVVQKHKSPPAAPRGEEARRPLPHGPRPTAT